jgi:hypothetical protein
MPTSTHPRTYKKVRMLVRWYCHNCDQLFMRGSKTCSSCEHSRCDDCRRVPAKKVKSPPVLDPEIMKSVEARLAALSLPDRAGDSGTAAPPGVGSGKLGTA